MSAETKKVGENIKKRGIDALGERNWLRELF